MPLVPVKLELGEQSVHDKFNKKHCTDKIKMRSELAAISVKWGGQARYGISDVLFWSVRCGASHSLELDCVTVWRHTTSNGKVAGTVGQVARRKTMGRASGSKYCLVCWPNGLILGMHSRVRLSLGYWPIDCKPLFTANSGWPSLRK